MFVLGGWVSVCLSVQLFVAQTEGGGLDLCQNCTGSWKLYGCTALLRVCGARELTPHTRAAGDLPRLGGCYDGDGHGGAQPVEFCLEQVKVRSGGYKLSRAFNQKTGTRAIQTFNLAAAHGD